MPFARRSVCDYRKVWAPFTPESVVAPLESFLGRADAGANRSSSLDPAPSMAKPDKDPLGVTKGELPDLDEETEPSPASSQHRSTDQWVRHALRIPSPGYLIDGKYRVLGLIAKGGMGAVVRARDVRLDREVAVKLIDPAKLGDAKTREAFEAEARLTAQIHHPCVVQIHAIGDFEGTPYLVLEYVRGPTLERHLEQRRPPHLGVEEVLRFLMPLARGLDAIHAAGMIHRDMKPANVLVGPNHAVKIIDMGIAQSLRAERGGAAGTPAYVAPEVARGHLASPASDLYALAITAFELFCAEPPYDGWTVVEILRKHVHAEIPSMQRYRSELPKELDAVMRLGLAKSPDARPRSCVEFVEKLAAAARASRVVSGAVAGGSVAPTRIAVVDDDEDARTYVADLLAGELPAVEVVKLGGGGNAFEALLREPVDLVISDLSMPEGDGNDLTRSLRAHPATRETPIIIVTGVGCASDWQRMSALGANAFLLKPFEPGDLLRATLRLLSSDRTSESAVARVEARWKQRAEAAGADDGSPTREPAASEAARARAKFWDRK